MATTSTANTQKSRGRPKTAFVSKKPKTKQDGPGRPKKIKEVEVIETTETFDKPIIIEDNKKKDIFILVMFLFSICVFTASLYFSSKKQAIEENANIQKQEQTIPEEVVTEEISTVESTGAIETEITETKQDTENTLLSSFYDAFNQNTLSEVYGNIDLKLRNSKLFKTYFSKTRIQRFLRNLDENGLQMSQINEQEGSITYKLSYTLQDGRPFEETRQIRTINTDKPLIGKIMCINTGCSTLPFFNPGKYNFK